MSADVEDRAEAISESEDDTVESVERIHERYYLCEEDVERNVPD